MKLQKIQNCAAGIIMDSEFNAPAEPLFEGTC